MKAVVIGGTGWTESHPVRVRGDLVRMVFSLAAQNGYDILVAGQSWRQSATPAKPHHDHNAEPMTPDRWASLMNYRPQ